MEFAKRGIIPRLFIVVLFIALSLVSLVFSAYLMLTARGGYVFALAIAFTTLALVSCLFNGVTAYAYYRSYYYDRHLEKLKKGLKPMRSLPTVAVIMPTYNEDLGMIERNMLSLKKLDYEKGKIRYYMHDDSKDPEVRSRKMAFCEANGVEYLTRSENTNFKAGALNNTLEHSQGEFIAIFDADEELTDTHFLKDLLPYFQDESIAFVQTEKRFSKGTLFSESVDLFDALFFRFIQPARALNGTAIFAGSCGIIRRAALDAIGGFPQFVTEDTFFSFESDIHGYRSVYVPQAYALGKPLTFSELMSQQWRYNYGDTQFLVYFLKRWRSEKKHSFSPISKLDYLAHGFGLNYLSSILILFTVVALLTVFSAAPFAYSTVTQAATAGYTVLGLELLGISAFLLSLIVPIALTKVYFNSYSKGLMLFVLNFALAFVRLKGAIAALLSMSGVKGWFKGSVLDNKPIRALYALKNATLELTFSVVLLIAGSLAALSYNLSGAMWLLWYGILYTSTFFFFYRYG